MAKNLLTIIPNDNLLRQFDNQIKSLGEQDARVAMARAVNRVTRSAYGKVIRAIVKQSSIPRPIVKKAIQIKLAAHKGSGPIQGEINASGRRISLREFNPKQFSWGVRVKAWGEWQKYEGSFIFGGTWRSGKPAFQGHVMTRVGKSSFPVRRENGPSVPDTMIIGESAHAFATTVEQMLPARISHELGRLLKF